MAQTATCFVVRGRCPGLGEPQLSQASTPIHSFGQDQPAILEAKPIVWRFDFQRPGSSSLRQGRAAVNASLTAWRLTEGPSPPNGARVDSVVQARPPSSRQIGAASCIPFARGYKCHGSCGAGVLSGDAAENVPLTGHATSVTDPHSTADDGANAGKAQPQRELLQLLGSSNHTAQFQLGHPDARPMQLQSVGTSALVQPRISFTTTTWASPAMAPYEGHADAAAWERPRPLDQLQAACLASVAAALVHLPRVWGEQGQIVSGVLMRCLGTSSRLTPAGAQVPVQPPQAQPQQGATLPVSESQTAGRQAAAALPPPAALALAAAPGAVERASSGWCEHRADSSDLPGSNDVGFARGGTRSDGGGGGPGASTTITVCRTSGSAAVSTAPQPPLPGTGPMQQGALATAAPEEAVAAHEAVVEVEAEKKNVFGNPVRYCKLLFAGAMSAVVSRTCVAPLERVKMDLLLKNGTGDAFTTAAQVLRTEGIGGFWKGNALNVLRTAPFKAVNFFSFDMYRSALLVLWGRDDNFERFLAGACAGVTATLVCFPLDVVRTRLMASVAGPRYGTGPFSTLAGILRNEGAAALYSGCLPAVIGMAPAGAVFYGVYDMLKHRHLAKLTEAKGAPGAPGQPSAVTAASNSSTEASAAVAAAQPPVTLEPLYTLLYGAMAGAASELIVYPLEVIRRKMQLHSMALANMRQVGGMHPHHHPHHNLFAPGSAGSSAAAAGPLAAAAHHHHHHYHHLHAQSHHLRVRRLIAAWSAAAVAKSPGLARVAAAVSAILATDGPRGFYSGMLPNILQVLPSAALSYYTYDTLKTLLGAQ